MTGYQSKKAAADAKLEKEAKVEPPAWWPAVENILKEYGLQAIDFVADFKEAIAEAEKPRLDRGRDYEEGFIDGMQHQMQLSVDKAVNAVSRQPLTDDAVFELADTNLYEGDKNYGVLAFARAIEAAHGIKGEA